MSTAVLIDLVVGEPLPGPDAPVQPVSLAEAEAVAALAQRAGVAALRLVDGTPGVRTIDPSVVGAYLAGRYGDLGYLVDVPTTHNAPYNLARRVLSFDRATSGRVGVVLRAGRGDEVSAATVPDPAADDPAGRWTEYARILTRLWESFPRDALIGDQERALVVDDRLIRPIAHDGRFYRVAGPLDGPSSVQGRPVLVAADLDVLGWSALADSADAVVVSQEQSDGADLLLTAALEQVGRDRADVALIGRAPASFTELATWVADTRLDAVELVPTAGVEEIADLLRDLVTPSPVTTLRAALGLREIAEVLA
jgi:alkanesulfonate monooxygenase SsuD/methylene tetrahydromethanopterin reductase-like flavin-dependent oxidoreductase (luciferase family)